MNFFWKGGKCASLRTDQITVQSEWNNPICFKLQKLGMSSSMNEALVGLKGNLTVPLQYGQMNKNNFFGLC